MNGQINLTAIKEVLVEVFQSLTGVEPFIFEDQAGPRPPEGNYGTLKLNPASVMIGQDDKRMTTGTGDKVIEEITGQRDFTCSVNLYRENANQIMSGLQLRLGASSTSELIRKQSLNRGQSFAIIDSLTVQDLTSLLQSEYEERSQMDIRLRTTASFSEELTTIGNVTLDGSVENVAGDIKAPGVLNITDS